MKFKVFTIRLTEGFREQDEAILNEFLETVVVKQVFASVVNDSWSLLVSYDEAPLQAASSPKSRKEKATPGAFPLSAEERSIYEALLQWRNEKAQQEGIAPYMVAPSESLRQVVKLRVRTREELLKVKGFRDRRVRKYGDGILRILEGEPPGDQSLYLEF